MKFGRDLLQKAVPEWQNGYVDYKQLKKRIKAIRIRFPKEELNLHPSRLAAAPAADSSQLNILRRASQAYQQDGLTHEERTRFEEIKASEEEREFLAYLDKELEKVNVSHLQELPVVLLHHLIFFRLFFRNNWKL